MLASQVTVIVSSLSRSVASVLSFTSLHIGLLCHLILFFLLPLINTESCWNSPEGLFSFTDGFGSLYFPLSVTTFVTVWLVWASSGMEVRGTSELSMIDETEFTLSCSSLVVQQSESQSQSAQHELLHASESSRDFLAGLVGQPRKFSIRLVKVQLF